MTSGASTMKMFASLVLGMSLILARASGSETPAHGPLAVAALQKRNLAAAKAELAKLDDWEAKAVLVGLELLGRFPARHPRLFANEARWPQVKRLVETKEAELFGQMQRRVKAQSLAGIQDGNFGRLAMDAALAYHITGDQEALEKARKMLRVTVDVIPQRRDGGSERAYPAIACAAALDWLWDAMPKEERLSRARALIADAWKRVEEAREAKILAEWPHYYVRAQFWFVGVALLDDELDAESWARAVSLIGIGLQNHRDRIVALREVAGESGVWQTNPDYDFAAVPSPMFAFFHTWQAATGEQVPAAWRAAGISPELALRTFPKIEKHRLYYMNYAGHSGGCWGFGEMRADLLPEFLADHIHFFGRSDPRGATIARHLLGRIGSASVGDLPVLRLLRGDLSGNARLPELPVARDFASVGLVMMSSGFSEGDTFALYSQGGGVKDRRHDHDATHFSIFRGGPLAVDSGARMAAQHSANYRHQTVAHNCVLIHMPGEKFPPSQSGPVTANGGGQFRNPEDSLPLAFRSTPLFTYIATDATSVYRETKCTQMTRQFFFLPPSHFVVFDRVIAREAGYAKSWLLHTGNEPEISNREFRADNEGSRLFCRTLLPMDAVLEKIGGEGKEFWSDGQNWPVEDFWLRPGAKDWWENCGKGHTSPPAAMGRWRVEVKPGAARTNDVFLHILQTADAATPAMTAIDLREVDRRVVLRFEANGRSYDFALNKSGPVGGTIRVLDGGKVLVNEELTVRKAP